MNTGEKIPSKTEKKILLSAYLVFSQQGFRRTTVREICKKAGVNIASVNYHFGNKEKLYIAVCKYACAMNEDKHPSTFYIQKDASDEEKLYMFVHSFLTVFLCQEQSTMRWELMSRELLEPTRALNIIIEEILRPQLNQLSEIVGRFLGNKSGKDIVTSCCYSIIGQCLYYRFSPLLQKPFYADHSVHNGMIEMLAENITRFSLHALKGISRE